MSHRNSLQTRDRVSFNTKFRGFSLPRRNPGATLSLPGSAPPGRTAWPKEGDPPGPSVSALGAALSSQENPLVSKGAQAGTALAASGVPAPFAPKLARGGLHTAVQVHCLPQMGCEKFKSWPRKDNTHLDFRPHTLQPDSMCHLSRCSSACKVGILPSHLALTASDRLKGRSRTLPWTPRVTADGSHFSVVTHRPPRCIQLTGDAYSTQMPLKPGLSKHPLGMEQFPKLFY